ncbi:MAG TPA: hypothetical protein VF883_10470 [Thermoanaerobaculia bacterium]|jgi:hypothetical protein
MIRRVAAALLFAALLASGARLPILRLLLPPHRPADAPAPYGALHRWPLRWMNDPTPPELLHFFRTIRAQTKPGERIALVLAPPYDGMGYMYWRASYELTGRPILLPVTIVPPDDADAIAIWDTTFEHPRFEQKWLDGKGALLRRKP